MHAFTKSLLLIVALVFALSPAIAMAQPGGGRGGRGGDERGRGGDERGRGGDERGRGGDDRGRGGDDRGRGGDDRGRGGDDRGRGGDDRGRGGDERGRGGFDPSAMLARMDANGNGKLDPDEMSDRMKQFMGPRLEQMGFDPNKAIELSKLSDAVQKRMNPEAEEEVGDLMVPQFGEPLEHTYPADFNLPSDSPLLDPRPVEDRYSESVNKQIQETLSRYDLNRDKVIDEREWRRVRWQDPSPEESDLDKNGRLSIVELAERYKGRDAGRDERRRQWEQQQRERSSQGGGDSRSSWGRGGGDSRSSYGRGGDSSSSRSGWGRSRGGDDDDDDEKEERSGSRERRSSQSDDDKYKAYTESMMKRYDKSGDGILQKEEWSEMRGSWDDADTDENGTLSPDEVTAKLKSYANRGRESSDRTEKGGGSSSSSRSGNSDVYRFQTLEERLADIGVGSDFTRDDKNNDGQLQMVEFVSDWTPDSIEEFRKRDANGDGVITAQEWVETGRRR